jgi:hypothetical protein
MWLITMNHDKCVNVYYQDTVYNMLQEHQEYSSFETRSRS